MMNLRISWISILCLSAALANPADSFAFQRSPEFTQITNGKTGSYTIVADAERFAIRDQRDNKIVRIFTGHNRTGHKSACFVNKGHLLTSVWGRMGTAEMGQAMALMLRNQSEQFKAIEAAGDGADSGAEFFLNSLGTTFKKQYVSDLRLWDIQNGELLKSYSPPKNQAIVQLFRRNSERDVLLLSLESSNFANGDLSEVFYRIIVSKLDVAKWQTKEIYRSSKASISEFSWATNPSVFLINESTLTFIETNFQGTGCRIRILDIEDNITSEFTPYAINGASRFLKANQQGSKLWLLFGSSKGLGKHKLSAGVVDVNTRKVLGLVDVGELQLDSKSQAVDEDDLGRISFDISPKGLAIGIMSLNEKVERLVSIKNGRLELQLVGSSKIVPVAENNATAGDDNISNGNTPIKIAPIRILAFDKDKRYILNSKGKTSSKLLMKKANVSNNKENVKSPGTVISNESLQSSERKHKVISDYRNKARSKTRSQSVFDVPIFFDLESGLAVYSSKNGIEFIQSENAGADMELGFEKFNLDSNIVLPKRIVVEKLGMGKSEDNQVVIAVPTLLNTDTRAMFNHLDFVEFINADGKSPMSLRKYVLDYEDDFRKSPEGWIGYRWNLYRIREGSISKICDFVAKAIDIKQRSTGDTFDCACLCREHGQTKVKHSKFNGLQCFDESILANFKLCPPQYVLGVDSSIEIGECDENKISLVVNDLPSDLLPGLIRYTHRDRKSELVNIPKEKDYFNENGLGAACFNSQRNQIVTVVTNTGSIDFTKPDFERAVIQSLRFLSCDGDELHQIILDSSLTSEQSGIGRVKKIEFSDLGRYILVTTEVESMDSNPTKSGTRLELSSTTNQSVLDTNTGSWMLKVTNAENATFIGESILATSRGQFALESGKQVPFNKRFARKKLIRENSPVSFAKTNLYVLGVAIDSYQEKSIRDLTKCKSDFDLLASHLTNELRRKYKSIFVQGLKDNHATKTNILEALTQCARVANSNDDVIIYFSGHGVTFQNGLYFLATDSTVESAARSAINWSQIAKSMLKIRANRKLLFIDTCYSGAFGDSDSNLFAKESADFRDLDGLLCVTSSTNEEQSFELDKGSPFAAALVEATSKRHEDFSKFAEFIVAKTRSLSSSTQTPTVIANNLAIEKFGFGTNNQELPDDKIEVSSTAKIKRPIKDIEWVQIPRGKFKMGSEGWDLDRLKIDFPGEQNFDYFDSERPSKNIRMSRSFYISKYEVTNFQFKKFIDETNYVTDAERSGREVSRNPTGASTVPNFKSWRWNSTYESAESLPVTLVSHNDCVEFCKWLSKKRDCQIRLPTQAEWEYACRANSSTRYSNGNDPEKLTSIANVPNLVKTRKFVYKVGSSKWLELYLGNASAQVIFAKSKVRLLPGDKTSENILLVNDTPETISVREGRRDVTKIGSKEQKVVSTQRCDSPELGFITTVYGQDKSHRIDVKMGCELVFTSKGDKLEHDESKYVDPQLQQIGFVRLKNRSKKSISVRLRSFDSRSIDIPPNSDLSVLAGQLKKTNRVISQDQFAGLAPVGSFAPNRFGLHDMHGNVWEWCQDPFYDYNQISRYGTVGNSPILDENPISKTGNLFVMRGGCFL